MIYSHRLVIATTAATWTSWRVPVGHRAVIRWITATNTAASAVICSVAIGASFTWRASVPGSSSVVTQEQYHVAYGNELVQARPEATGCTIVVSGFVFVDDTNAVGPGGITFDYPGEAPMDAPPLPSPA